MENNAMNTTAPATTAGSNGHANGLPGGVAMPAAPGTPGAAVAQPTELLGPIQERVLRRRDQHGSRLNESWAYRPVPQGTLPLTESEAAALLAEVESSDPLGARRLAYGYEVVRQAYLVCLSAVAQITGRLQERQQEARRRRSLIDANLTRLIEERDKACHLYQQRAEEMASLHSEAQLRAVGAAAKTGAELDPKAPDPKAVLAPRQRSREEAAEELRLKLPVSAVKRPYAKAIAVLAPYAVGGFCGIGMFSKIGWITRGDVVTGALWTEKLHLALAGLVVGVAVFTVGGLVAEAFTRAAARESAFGFSKMKAWLKYALAGLASLGVMCLDAFMQHEGIKVLTLATDKEKAAAGDFVWVYFVFGLAIVFAYVLLKAAMGHEEGWAEGSRDRADVWCRAEEAKEAEAKRKDSAVQDALAAIGEARELERERLEAEAELEKRRRPFQAKIEDLEKLRIEEPEALTEHDRKELQQVLDEYSGASAEFEALLEQVAPLARRPAVRTARIGRPRGGRRGLWGWLANLFGR
jgi:hypothetical protein